MRRKRYLFLMILMLSVGGCTKKYPAVAPEPATQVSETAAENRKETKSAPKPPESESDNIEEPEPVYDFMIASDIHYLAEALTDHGSVFNYTVDHGDGKVVQYISQIVDAFVDEVIARKPGALILSGDLSLNGERLSHGEFAEKLKRVEAEGIPVIVIPGNHDINNPAAAEFKGNNRFPAAYISAQEFKDICQDYGFNEAIAKDASSLSYVYQLDENIRFLMLDSCQYEPENRVGGMIKTETYEWIEAQLEAAWEDSMTLIPISHHNLLDESEVYVEDCTIEHSEELISLLEDWNIPIYLSGHLHVQHTKQAWGDEGIYEMVTSSLATPPCQYGILEILDNDSYRYRTQAVDMEGWAARKHSENEELLHFEAFKAPFLSNVFYNQAQDKMKDRQIPDKTKDGMAKIYAQLNASYYAGQAVQVKRKVTASPLYRCWEDYMFDDILLQYMQSILNDAERDYNTAVIEY